MLFYFLLVLRSSGCPSNRPESGRRGSNSRPLAWKANALSTELLPHFRSLLSPQNPIDGTNRQPECHYDRFSNPKIQFAVANRIRIEWEKMDSNHRRRTSADLQSAPFGHSGILPICNSRFCNRCPVGFKSAGLILSRWRDSNPRPADYKSAALAN